jgi:hypothetical protein
MDVLDECGDILSNAERTKKNMLLHRVTTVAPNEP